jgi:NAD(P)-dependent dehydrogenase (short-subunit alcohol dehydrogenase family)
MSAGTSDIAGKVALITGASRGLGRAIACGLAREGVTVALAARTKASLESVRREILEAGGQALAIPTDITDSAAVSDLVEATVDGLGRIDILVNNSGVLRSAPLLQMKTEEWDEVFSTNLRGMFILTRAVGKHMTARASGKIINIASNFAFLGVPNHTAYCASKAAVVSLTKSLAIEWAGFNVQVNAIAPGYFETEMTAEARNDAAVYARILKSLPTRRMGTPEEIVPWVTLLASSASNYITGETLVIDGGQSAR